jgi:hypothetical protein
MYTEGSARAAGTCIKEHAATEQETMQQRKQGTDQHGCSLVALTGLWLAKRSVLGRGSGPQIQQLPAACPVMPRGAGAAI